MSKVAKASAILSMVIVVFLGINYLLSHFSMSDLEHFAQTYHWRLLLVYMLILNFRGLFFYPTMPLILMMAAIIPSIEMFLATWFSSILSSLWVTYAVDYLGVTPKLLQSRRRGLRRARVMLRRHGTLTVVSWAFFPFVFTEFIVYLSRMAGMNRKRILLLVAIGEGGLIVMMISLTHIFTNILLGSANLN